MSICLIGLGANVGSRRETLNRAIADLSALPQTRLIAISPWLETGAVGGPAGQGDFLNGAATFETSLAPAVLHHHMKQVEAALGRQRQVRWGPRTVDLDLLLYDLLVIDEPELQVPHPRMAWRRFVLEPAAAVAADMIHPTIGWSVDGLLDHLNTTLPYVAIAGAIGAGKTHLARRLGKDADVRWISEAVDPSRLSTFYGDPSGTAWQTELEFLRERAMSLSVLSFSDSAPDACSSPCGWTISDFWFDQSMAFARIWLPQSQQEAFGRRWLELREHVARPRLVVLLNVPVAVLAQRVRLRNRPFEQSLEESTLRRIRDSLEEQAQQAEVGPVMRLGDQTTEESYIEVRAALDSMA